MELRRQLAIVRSRFLLIVLGVVVAGGLGYFLSSMEPRIYEAKATLVVGQSLSGANPGYDQLLASQRLASTYATVATTRPILEDVIKALRLDMTPTALIGKVQAAATADSSFLTVTARDTDPARAAAIANELAAQLVAASPTIQGRQADVQQSVDEDLKATQDQIIETQAEVERLAALDERTAEEELRLETLRGQLVSLRSVYASLLPYSSSNASNVLTVVQPAIAPDGPVSPRPLFNTLLAAAVGLIAVSAGVFVAEYLDDRLRTTEDVQEDLGLPTVGAIAQMKAKRGSAESARLAAQLLPYSQAAEAFRTLRFNIEFSAVDTPIQSILVTSSVPGEGKTLIASNLAVVFSRAGRRVLLVDGDLRKPGLHQIFNLPNSQGLTTLLRSDEVSPDAVIRAVESENLRVLTTGPLPPNPAELLGSQRMRTILGRLQAESDILIFDSAPLHVATDSAILASFLDGTLFVVDAGRTRRDTARRALETLATANARVVGVVLNRMPKTADAERHAYYGGHYGPDLENLSPAVVSVPIDLEFPVATADALSEADEAPPPRRSLSGRPRNMARHAAGEDAHTDAAGAK